jgi:hypothetical protein
MERRAVLALVGGALVGSVGTASAGDNLTVLQFAESEIEAESGETLDLDVLARSHGGYGGAGVASIGFTVEYDPEAIEIREVEAGPWLEGGEAEVIQEVDLDDGRAAISQEREPADDGISGTDRVATLTVEIERDLGPADVLLEFEESGVMLTDDYPQPVVERPARIVVDGGGEELAPEGSEPAVTTPGEDDENEGDDGGDQDGDGSEDDPADDGRDGPDTDDVEDDTGGDGEEDEHDAGVTDEQAGFGVLAACGALGLALWRLTRRQ